MSTFRKVVGDAVARLLFRELTVESAHPVAPRFRRLTLAGEALRGASFAAGDKVQLMIDGDARTYTPFGFDGARGAMSLLAYVHGDAPASRWGRDVAPGQRVYAFGPRGSLPLATLAGPVVLFGDETSFGVAQALTQARGSARDLAFVFETSHPSDASLALADLELASDGLVERTDGGGHLREVEERVRAQLARHPRAHLVLTGKAPSIQALRAALRSRPAVHGRQLVKAYWAPGKRGLD